MEYLQKGIVNLGKHIENNIKSIEKRIEHMEVKAPPKKKEKIIINNVK